MMAGFPLELRTVLSHTDKAAISRVCVGEVDSDYYNVEASALLVSEMST